MTIRLINKPAFVTADGESKTLHYTISGTTSENVARNYFLTATSNSIVAAIGQLYRSAQHIQQTAYDQFDIDVTYVPKQAKTLEVGEWSIDFDTTGGNCPHHEFPWHSHLRHRPVRGARQQKRDLR